jgi:hypothetical protein
MEARLLSKIHLNIFILMNAVEKSVNKNRNFTTLLEDWRCLSRVKIDSIQVMPEFSPAIHKEMAVRGNFMLEFIEKWGAKRIGPNQLREEYLKEQTKADEEIRRLIIDRNSRATLSYRFQNIHIVQLTKLAEEDRMKAKKISISQTDTKQFNFWKFFERKFIKNIKI